MGKVKRNPQAQVKPPRKSKSAPRRTAVVDEPEQSLWTRLMTYPDPKYVNYQQQYTSDDTFEPNLDAIGEGFASKSEEQRMAAIYAAYTIRPELQYFFAQRRAVRSTISRRSDDDETSSLRLEHYDLLEYLVKAVGIEATFGWDERTGYNPLPYLENLKRRWKRSMERSERRHLRIDPADNDFLELFSDGSPPIELTGVSRLLLNQLYNELLLWQILRSDSRELWNKLAFDDDCMEQVAHYFQSRSVEAFRKRVERIRTNAQQQFDRFLTLLLFGGNSIRAPAHLGDGWAELTLREALGRSLWFEYLQQHLEPKQPLVDVVFWNGAFVDRLSKKFYHCSCGGHPPGKNGSIAIRIKPLTQTYSGKPGNLYLLESHNHISEGIFNPIIAQATEPGNSCRLVFTSVQQAIKTDGQKDQQLNFYAWLVDNPGEWADTFPKLTKALEETRGPYTKYLLSTVHFKESPPPQRYSAPLEPDISLISTFSELPLTF
ncbi:MAG: hypothetical protein M3R24_19790 [Chloroflexota bacterium]|nr:hypothetical protein [Chloroflexota bacterium]